MPPSAAYDWKASAEATPLKKLEVGDGGFGAGDDEAVWSGGLGGVAELGGVVDVAEADAGLAGEWVEVVKVGDAGEAADDEIEIRVGVGGGGWGGHGKRSFGGDAVFLGEAEVVDPGDDAEDGDVGALFEVDQGRVERGGVATEAVDEKAAHEGALVRGE